MKKSIYVTKALACVFASAAICSAAAVIPSAGINNLSALAEESSYPAPSLTVYPETFERELQFTSLADYAVNGDIYAFADGTYIKTISPDDGGDRVLETFDCGFEIKNLDYSDGNLYVGNAEGKAFVYPDVTATVDYEFVYLTQAEVDGYTYLLGTEGLFCFDGSSPQIIGEGYSVLKIYGGRAFAIKDNALYALNESTAEAIECDYTDFSSANTVAVGSSREALKSGYTVNTVTVASGAYCTKIDLDETDGEYFKAISTVKLSGEMKALALTESGNATIIVMNDGEQTCSYITLTSSLTPSAYVAPEKDMTNAFPLFGTAVYASPYISQSTEIAAVTQTTLLTVEEKFSLDFIPTRFYKVSYTDEGGNTVSGYIPANLLSPYTFSAENNQTQTVADEFDYSDNVETVILVLIIVGLVIIAIAYLTVIGTRSGKNKNKKKKPSAQPEIREEEEA